MRFLEPGETGKLRYTELTPDELAEVYRLMRAEFTAQDLVDLINANPEDYVDGHVMLAEMEAEQAEYEARVA